MFRADRQRGYGRVLFRFGRGLRRQSRSARPVPVIRTAGCVGVLVAAGLAFGATTSARTPPASDASIKTACCYEVHADADGSFDEHFGTNPKNGIVGTEKFDWAWSEFELAEYTENDGTPDLEPVSTPSGHFAPLLDYRSKWLSRSNDGYMANTAPCERLYLGRPHLAHNISFTDIEATRPGYPNVEKYGKGHKYVLQIVGGNDPGLTPCGYHYAKVAVGLEPP